MVSPRAGTLAAGGNAAGEREHQAAHGLDLGLVLLLRQQRADMPLELLHRHARVEVEAAVGAGEHLWGIGLVMLVGDVAHDFLDDVLDGHQPVDAAVLVDHQRHVHPRGAHLAQQVEHGLRRRHEQRLAEQVLDREGGGAGAGGEQVADMDHADDVIERLAVDRHSRVPLALEQAGELVEIQRGGGGDDVGARHHHVIGRGAAQAQHVADERALLRVERGRGLVPVAGGFLGAGLDQLLEALAQAFVVALADHPAQAIHQAGDRSVAAHRRLL